MLAVNGLHHDSQITDLLYFQSDKLDGNKYLITCSELPSPEIIVSEVDANGKSMKVIAKASNQLQENSECGYTCLAQNPLDREFFASSSQVIDDMEQGIALWELNPDSWKDGKADYSI